MKSSRVGGGDAKQPRIRARAFYGTHSKNHSVIFTIDSQAREKAENPTPSEVPYDNRPWGLRRDKHMFENDNSHISVSPVYI